METGEQLPSITSPATAVYIQSQLSVLPEYQSVFRRARDNFARNISALREVDADFAEELSAAPDPADMKFVDIWGAIHLFDPTNKKVLVIPERFSREVQQWLDQWVGIAITQVFTGQELIYCLTKQKNLMHGRRSLIYLMDSNLSNVRVQLHLWDFSEFIRKQELIIFCGRSVDRQLERVFGTLRYYRPHTIIGNEETIKPQLKQIESILDSSSERDAAEAYYRSEEFSRRLGEIAAGRIMPRGLVITCRWTTFLKYCASDFRRAFEKLGCEMEYLIEEGDTQLLTPRLTWKTISDFRPDFLFSVSHARPSFWIPKELPVIGYIQDLCGSILTATDLSQRTSAEDLLICQNKEFQRYLVSRKVPERQTFLLPVPANEDQFYPLPADSDIDSRYRVDVGFVKHCDFYVGRELANFIEQNLGQLPESGIKSEFVKIFTNLHEIFSGVRDRRVYEQDLLEYVASRVRASDPSIMLQLEQLTKVFYVNIICNVWRYQFLEALDGAGIQLGLYGNHWSLHPRLGHLDRGPANRGSDINHIYNFNKISLNIHPYETMHQRVSECALAGGFLMGADHSPERDWESVRPYFEPGREIVLFDTAADLVEKCRYYLAHGEERMAISQRARASALAEQTTLAAAGKILSRWRSQLTEVQLSRKGG